MLNFYFLVKFRTKTVFEGKKIWFSWRDQYGSPLQNSWYNARQFCQSRCMELVTIDSKAKNEFLKTWIYRGKTLRTRNEASPSR